MVRQGGDRVAPVGLLGAEIESRIAVDLGFNVVIADDQVAALFRRLRRSELVLVEVDGDYIIGPPRACTLLDAERF